MWRLLAINPNPLRIVLPSTSIVIQLKKLTVILFLHFHCRALFVNVSSLRSLRVVCDKDGVTHANLCVAQCLGVDTAVAPGACATESCPLGCLQCQPWARDQCLRCGEGLVQHAGMCLAACPAGMASFGTKYGAVCHPAPPVECNCPLLYRPGM